MNRTQSNQFAQILCFIGILVLIHAVNVLSGMWLNDFGVLPRTLIGLRGVIFSPLLHGNWGHLLGNIVPLAVMMGLIAFIHVRSLWPVMIAIWIASGFAVWLVGRPGAVQIGASGLIYGLAAYLVVAAWIRREWKSVLAALVVIFLYGGIVRGLLPTHPQVSWEGHLAGAIAGGLVAWRSPRRA